MFTILWILAMVAGISFVCIKTRPQPVKASAKKTNFYTPRLIDADGTIVCMKDVDTRV
jgi:hypothetical protein